MLIRSDANACPSFAVVIPLYNHQRYIGPAIESVLAQTRPADAIILIDDGSNDDGLAVAARLLEGRPGTVVRSQPNAGAHITLNRCIEASRDHFIAVLNSDDLFHPGKIARCAQLIADRPDVDLIIGGVRIIDSDGATVQYGETVSWLERAHAYLKATGLLSLALLHENFAVTTSNMVFRRELWRCNGGFQPLRYCHDVDFLMASARNGVVYYDGSVEHIAYRIHAQNTIKETLSKIQIEIAGVLTSALIENGLKLTDGVVNAGTTAALLEMIRQKNMSDLVLLLVRAYASHADRSRFYQDLMSPQLQPVYLQALERPAPPPAMPEARPSAPLTRLAALPASGRDTIKVAIEVGSFDKGGLEKVWYSIPQSVFRNAESSLW